jgi:hypothetical protein
MDRLLVALDVDTGVPGAITAQVGHIAAQCRASLIR